MKEAGGQKMRERSGLAEHPFGTLKHRAGWSHFLVRGFEKVGGEWALMATCYNFARVLNIIGLEAFKEYCLERQKDQQNRQNRAAEQNSTRIWGQYIPIPMPPAFRAQIFVHSSISGSSC